MKTIESYRSLALCGNLYSANILYCCLSSEKRKRDSCLKRKKETVFLSSQKKEIQLSEKKKKEAKDLRYINGAHKDKQFVKVEEKKDNLICQIFEN